MVATGGVDGSLCLWDTFKARILKRLHLAEQSLLCCKKGSASKRKNCAILSIAFSPNGQILASGSEDGKIVFWRVETLTHIKTLQQHLGRVTAVVFGHDSKLFVSGGSDKTIRVWNLSTFSETSCLSAHADGGVTTLCLSADGKSLASGSEDSTIKLWDF